MALVSSQACVVSHSSRLQQQATSAPWSGVPAREKSASARARSSRLVEASCKLATSDGDSGDGGREGYDGSLSISSPFRLPDVTQKCECYKMSRIGCLPGAAGSTNMEVCGISSSASGSNRVQGKLSKRKEVVLRTAIHRQECALNRD